MYSNQFIYSKERRRFGRQCLFRDRNELMVSVHPSGRLRMKYIMRNPTDRGTQLTTSMALSIMETMNKSYEHRTVSHMEGGWPKEVNVHDEEQTLRHRKKVEREDSWGDQVTRLVTKLMDVVDENNALNIYQDFFSEMPADMGNDIRMRWESRNINVFHDIWNPVRPIAMIDWMPNNRRQFITLFVNKYGMRKDSIRMVSDESGYGSENAFYVWDFKNPLKPKLFYDCPEVIYRAKICPKDENNLAGGLSSGKVCMWHTFKAGNPLRTCPLEAAHREATSALCWVHSKSNTEFYSGSLDGSIKYWDTRDLKMPVHELMLEPDAQEIQNRQNSHGALVLEFEYTIPVRFIIGSDMGTIFVGNRKGMTAPETLLAQYKMFSGPVRTITRNPFFVKNFIITGDWRARIWSEESKDSPSTMYVKSKGQILCGAWSSARCSMFVTGNNKGQLDFWDLLLHHRKPIWSVKFKSAITDAIFRAEGDLLAVAFENGDTRLLQIDDVMKQSTGKEKALIAAMFEREISRCKVLEARVEEMRLKRRTQLLAEEERLRREEIADPDLELDADNPEHFVQLIEADEQFRNAISEFQESVLAVEKKRSNRKARNDITDFEQWYLDHLEVPLDDMDDEPILGSVRNSLRASQPNTKV
ncbi:dynein intermediate chain 3, ciliary [Scaptodrosophila lebanonensis]|uniref:Dynein intermediate chain 3, ciliary n=1 Tax=Drosophila lebanonensis TaxID=7225 RepID=A0A6J2TMY7_DROLE|nr:dynein intermediate chain 3, ciliary [Scaptodrosophila lebanonensis]